MAKKFSGENNLTQIFQLIEERYNFLKEQIENADKMFVVEFGVSLSSSGMTLSLPSDVTFENISNAYDNNYHVIGIFDIPAIAGDSSGKYIAPANKRNSDGSILFVASDKSTMQWIQIFSDGTVDFAISRYEFTGNKVTSLSASSTDTQYPSAKAVYDALGGLTLKVATSAPTVDDRSVITFVVEG